MVQNRCALSANERAGRLARGGFWAAATARETRLGYFTEAQPFEVACARGWFEGGCSRPRVCRSPRGRRRRLSMATSKLVYWARRRTPRAREVEQTWPTHLKGESQALLVRPEHRLPADLQGMIDRQAFRFYGALLLDLHTSGFGSRIQPRRLARLRRRVTPAKLTARSWGPRMAL